MKKYILSALILFSTTLLFGQFPESFEGETFPPEGWKVFSNGIGEGYQWQISDQAYVGEAAAFVRWENVEDGIAEDWLVTPAFTPSQESHILSFFQKDSYAVDYFSSYSIRVSIASQSDPGDFEIIDEQGESDMRLYYTYHEVDLSAYIGKDIYLAFVMSNDDGDNWIIDEINMASCAIPSGLYADNFTANGADLFWNDDGSGSWNLEVVEKGEIPTGNPDVENVNTIPFNWQGGEAFTQYEFYVWANCYDGSQSNISSSYGFTTDCANSSCDYVFVLEDAYGDDWNGAYIEIYQNGISMGQVTQEERGFGPYYYYFSFCDDQEIQLQWHSGNWDQECIFSFYDTYDQNYFSFEAGDYPSNEAIFYMGNADCDPVTCRFPYDVMVDDLQTHGATIHWTEKDDATLWDLEFVQLGDLPTGEPSVENISTNPYRWTGGEPGTYYRVYARAKCSDNDWSKWSVPSIFSTICDDFVKEYPYQEDFISDYLLPYCWHGLSEGRGRYFWRSGMDYNTGDDLVYIANDRADQDEWLVSPTFDFSGVQDEIVLSFDWKTSYYWMVFPYDKGDVKLRISTDGGQSWAATPWNEEMHVQFTSFEWQKTLLDLSDYIGFERVNLAFQYQGNDASSFYLDNVIIEDGSGTITSVEWGQNEEMIKIFPNPTEGFLTISMDKSAELQDLQVLDLSGRALMKVGSENNFNGIKVLDVSSLNEGLYFVSFKLDGERMVRKFVKQ